MIRIKFMGRGASPEITKLWWRQIASGNVVSRCEFIFDFDAKNYDWFVVYDDLPRLDLVKRAFHFENLSCPPENTILLTSEPSSVRRYPRAFLDQFNFVLSSQEPKFISHPGHIRQQVGLRWYYGIGSTHIKTLDEMIAQPISSKTRDLSTIVSAKTQTHTLHARRVEFIQRLSMLVPSLERLGHGIRLIDDKAEALDPYRYHIAIENHIAPHHWTEKLSDAFLASALPFYIGAPDIFDYFPEDSLIVLNLDDPEESAHIIRNAIAAQAWETRLPAILEARRLVIERYGLFQNLAHLIERLSSEPVKAHHRNRLHMIESANGARRRRPVYSLFERIKNVSRFLPMTV